MRREWQLLALAVQALTRVPVAVAFEPEAFRRSVRYFPVVGAGVGLVGGAAFVLLAAGLPPPVAAVGAVAAMAVLTGALHEDGLADCCDGFGGGRTAADALRIMRDSRIGAFGALGLVLAVGAKLTLVPAVEAPFWVLAAAGGASRAWVVMVSAALPYARSESQDGGQAGGVAGAPRRDVVLAGAFGVAALCLLGERAAAGLLLSGLVAAACAWAARRRLGGYTGDVLGAVQQLTEIAVLAAAAWRAG